MDEPVKTGHVYPAGHSVFEGEEPEDIYRKRNAMLVRALRSGSFTQAQGTLEAVRSNGYRTEVTGHCCLGVACRVAEREAVGFWVVARVSGGQTDFATIIHDEYGEVVLSEMTAGYPPRLVKEWFGWKATNPHLFYLHPDGTEDSNSAAYLNDNHLMSFDGIADAFERTFVTYTYKSVDDLTDLDYPEGPSEEEQQAAFDASQDGTGITDLPG